MIDIPTQLIIILDVMIALFIHNVIVSIYRTIMMRNRGLPPHVQVLSKDELPEEFKNIIDEIEKKEKAKKDSEPD